MANFTITLDKLEKNKDFLCKPIDEKWTIIFKNPDFIGLKKLVSVMLSIFSSNAFCESIFSIVKNVKSDERNRMKIKLLNSLMGIKTNCDMECTEAYDLFISSPELLNKTKSSEKYDL